MGITMMRPMLMEYESLRPMLVIFLASHMPSDPFSFERWPLTRERHRADLLNLKNTHRILPIPAYDLANDLLKPSTYRRYLQGALVEIHFSLSHWGIAGVKRDVYGGEIELIRLLEPPLGSTSPDRKRKIPLHLAPDEPPHKKCAHT